MVWLGPLDEINVTLASRKNAKLFALQSFKWLFALLQDGQKLTLLLWRGGFVGQPRSEDQF